MMVEAKADAVRQGNRSRFELLKIVPWEIWHGQRLNINRLLGNGRDDNGNNVVDESSEADAGEFVWPDLTPDTLNPGDSGRLECDPVQLRESVGESGVWRIIRTHQVQSLRTADLCSSPLLPDDDAHRGSRSGRIPVSRPRNRRWTTRIDSELTAHRIAQWAINVVDFRDADAIMTPFEYDVNPFNGWLAYGRRSLYESRRRRK